MDTVLEYSPFLSYNLGNIKYVDLNKSSRENEIYSSSFIACLKTKFQIQILDNTSIKISASVAVLKYLEKCLLDVQSNYSSYLPNDINTALTELYRALRNSSTTEEAQNFIGLQTNILPITRNIIDLVESDSTCMKLILQFLINLITSNRTVSQKLHEGYCDLFPKFSNEQIFPYEFSALLYNISLSVSLKIDMVECMLNLSDENSQNEFTLFFIENCLKSGEFWNIYSHLKITHRLIMLEALKAQNVQSKDHPLPISGLNILIDGFLKSPDIFFKLNSVTVCDEAHEVSLLLDIVASLSSEDEYVRLIQENRNVLINASALLINFHKLGKEKNNQFSPIQKLSENVADESSNPVFGLKADLIRLIGNMCWKNTALQNLAREAEVIPVILDCCNIDVKNPFIIQWCIFAIRNVCENNLENQKVIAGLHQKAPVPSQVLDEFGLTLHNDGESQLKIVPLDSLHCKK